MDGPRFCPAGEGRNSPKFGVFEYGVHLTNKNFPSAPDDKGHGNDVGEAHYSPLHISHTQIMKRNTKNNHSTSAGVTTSPPR